MFNVPTLIIAGTVFASHCMYGMLPGDGARWCHNSFATLWHGGRRRGSVWRMYPRRTQTRNTPTGEHYYTHRRVRSRRSAEGKVWQVTLLHLGRHFSVAQEQWPGLCARIEQLLSAQSDRRAVECSATLEREAQRCAAQY